MKSYHIYVKLPASPELVYTAFTNPFTMELWSDESAQITLKENTSFSWFDGAITGITLRFETNKLLEQQWDFGEQAEASVVTLKFHEDKKGTSLEVKHTNIPEEAYDDIVDGWENYVFDTLKDYYSED